MGLHRLLVACGFAARALIARVLCERVLYARVLYARVLGARVLGARLLAAALLAMALPAGAAAGAAPSAISASFADARLAGLYERTLALVRATLPGDRRERVPDRFVRADADCAARGLWRIATGR